jgi:hypothetical protein
MNRARIFEAVTWLAIELFYLMTFGLAAWLKWSQGMPDWFATQFQATWLTHAPLGLQGSFYFIAILETAAFVGFSVSVVRLDWLRGQGDALRLSLAFSMLVFVVLAYGSRLTQKFDVAGWNYLYLIGTFLIGRVVEGRAVEQAASTPPHSARAATTSVPS